MGYPHMRRKRHTPLNILRSFVVIVISMLLCSLVSAFMLQYDCLSTFYDRLPVYPDAAPITDNSSVLNYIGIGTADLQYYTSDDPETVHFWYQQEAIIARQLQFSDEPPPEWRGAVNLHAMTDDPGTTIYLTAVCRVARLEDPTAS